MVVTHKNNLRFYRKLNDLSLTQLGNMLGKKGETLMRIESGERSPTVEFAMQLAEINVEFNELFFKEGQEPQRRIVYMNRK